MIYGQKDFYSVERVLLYAVVPSSKTPELSIQNPKSEWHQNPDPKSKWSTAYCRKLITSCEYQLEMGHNMRIFSQEVEVCILICYSKT